MRAGTLVRAATPSGFRDLGRGAGAVISRWSEATSRGPAQDWLLAGLLEAVLLGILMIEIRSPTRASVGALTLVPVAAAAWLLEGSQLRLVLGVAIGLRIAPVLSGDVYFLTALTDIAALSIVAYAVHQTRIYIRRERQLDRLAEHRARELAVLAERERIARSMVQGATRRLFGVSLGLQATRALAETEQVSDRLESAIGELDEVISGLRNDLFRPQKQE